MPKATHDGVTAADGVTGPRHDGDLRLVRDSLAGVGSATDTLVERLGCVPPILSSLNRQMGSQLQREDLADLSQDVLVIVWGKRKIFEGRARLETWVYRVCFLEFMNRLRSRIRLSKHDGPRLDGVTDFVAAPATESHADSDAIERELVNMGPPEEDVIRLKHFEHHTFEALGKILDLSPNTAKTHYYRGIARLRHRLAPSAREETR